MTDPSTTADREIVLTRVYDAPRELVWTAWTDPKHMANWWGPNGFTTTVTEWNVRAGGVCRYVMHGPDGRDYNNRVIYYEVVRPERLVYSIGNDNESEPVSFRATVTFEDEGGKTRLTLHTVFPTAEERERVVREYGAIEGGKQTLARLAEYLPTMATK
jgi:uncharacterized protein YndB with AHSA1/START domain